MTNYPRARSAVVRMLNLCANGRAMVNSGCSHEVVARAAWFVATTVEREACAKLCDGIAEHYGQDGGHVADHCAIDIRTRG